MAKKVPNGLQVTDMSGQTINIPDSKQGYTLLVFLRYAGCPWCNLTIHRLTLEHKRLKESDCTVVAFIQSDEGSIKKNIYGRHDPRPIFPIIADKAKRYYDQFDVNSSVIGALRQVTKAPYWLKSVYKLGFKNGKISGDLFIVPAWFLINNRSREVINSARGVDLYDDEAFLPIYESLNFSD